VLRLALGTRGSASPCGAPACGPMPSVCAPRRWRRPRPSLLRPPLSTPSTSGCGTRPGVPQSTAPIALNRWTPRRAGADCWRRRPGLLRCCPSQRRWYSCSLATPYAW